MLRLVCIIFIMLTAMPTVLAQDWQDVDDNGIAYNCELIEKLAEEYGDENIVRDFGLFTSLADFLDDLFFDCSEQPIKEEMKVVFALYDNVMHRFGEPECSILIDDYFSEDFTIFIGGERLDGLAVDVYLPGESQAIEIDTVDQEVTNSGVPFRRERIEGDAFPLGNYWFNVHIDDETHHFTWRRTDHSFNTFSLSCPNRQSVSEDDTVDQQDDGEQGIAIDTTMSEAPALDDSTEVLAVLTPDERYSIDEKDCSVIVNDGIEGDFNIAISGPGQDRMSVDVYLPGESVPMQMDHIHSYTHDLGEVVPARTEWAEGTNFPMGMYTFDVHIDDATYRFMWRRTDHSLNTLSLSCPNRQSVNEDDVVDLQDDGEQGIDINTTMSEAPALDDSEATDHGEAAADDVGNAIIVLDTTEGHRLEDEGCIFLVGTEYKENFNVAIIGKDQGRLSVDVFLPGEAEPVVMDGVHEYEEDVGIIIPARVESAEGDSFPLGVYSFDVHIGDGTYRFQWEREDDDHRSITLACFGKGGLIPELQVLRDNEKTFIPETDCLVWTEAWDEEFNIVIIGQKQDAMTVEVFFPGTNQPEEMDSVSNGEFDSGTPYRVEWISGESFPLGLFNIDVTIEGQLYQYQWEREDQSVNTFGVECVSKEDE